jgi:3-oxoacyl-[acyl-carrier-protein] synthase II
MTATQRVVITGWSILSPCGFGADAIRQVLTGAPCGGASDVTETWQDPPPRAVRHVPSFDVRALLGRKGTSSYDRVTALAVVVCGNALEDAGDVLTRHSDDRVGAVMGTTLGSLASTMNFSRDTFVHDRPYLVNPVLFPNTVMNCAAGQVAIRHGLRGVNATISGGSLAMLQTLAYARNALQTDAADALVVGAAEEVTENTAWNAHLLSANDESIVPAEAAGAFVLERPADGSANQRVDAEVRSVVIASAPAHGSMSPVNVMTRCIQRALEEGAVHPDEVRMAAFAGSQISLEDHAIGATLGERPVERLFVRRQIGECQAASGAAALGLVLARHQRDPSRDGDATLITASTPDGGVGAAVVRGWSRGRRDRG